MDKEKEIQKIEEYIKKLERQKDSFQIADTEWQKRRKIHEKIPLHEPPHLQKMRENLLRIVDERISENKKIIDKNQAMIDKSWKRINELEKASDSKISESISVPESDAMKLSSETIQEGLSISQYDQMVKMITDLQKSNLDIKEQTKPKTKKRQFLEYGIAFVMGVIASYIGSYFLTNYPK